MILTCKTRTAHIHFITTKHWNINEENCSQNYQTTRPDHLFTFCKCNVPMNIWMFVLWTAQCKWLFLWKGQYLSCGERHDTDTVCHCDRTVTCVGFTCTCCHADDMVLCTRTSILYSINIIKRCFFKREHAWVWVRLTLRWRFQKSTIKMSINKYVCGDLFGSEGPIKRQLCRVLLSGCIMGNAGSCVSRVWPILRTDGEDTLCQPLLHRFGPIIYNLALHNCPKFVAVEVPF